MYSPCFSNYGEVFKRLYSFYKNQSTESPCDTRSLVDRYIYTRLYVRDRCAYFDVLDPSPIDYPHSA